MMRNTLRYVFIIMILLANSPVHSGVVIDTVTIPNIIQQASTMIKNKELGNAIVDSQTTINKIKGEPAKTKTPVDRPLTFGDGDENLMYTNCFDLQKVLDEKNINAITLYNTIEDCYPINPETFYNSDTTPMQAQVNVARFSGFDGARDTVSVKANEDAGVKNSAEALQQQAHVTAEAARALALKTHDDIKNKQASEFKKSRGRLDEAKTINALKKAVTNIKQKIALEIHKDGVLLSNNLAIMSMQKLQGVDYKNTPKSSKSGS